MPFTRAVNIWILTKPEISDELNYVVQRRQEGKSRSQAFFEECRSSFDIQMSYQKWLCAWLMTVDIIFMRTCPSLTWRGTIIVGISMSCTCYYLKADESWPLARQSAFIVIISLHIAAPYMVSLVSTDIANAYRMPLILSAYRDKGDWKRNCEAVKVLFVCLDLWLCKSQTSYFSRAGY